MKGVSSPTLGSQRRWGPVVAALALIVALAGCVVEPYPAYPHYYYHPHYYHPYHPHYYYYGY